MTAPNERMVAKLLATTAVTDLVVDRIFPVERPVVTAEALPAVVYLIMSKVPSNTANGTSTTEQMRIEVQCLAATYDGARALGAAVQIALSGWNDAEGSVWHLDDSRDDPGEVATGEDFISYHCVTQEYLVWY